ncbi:MAG: ABC transporter permease subunit [Clostridium sp.]
MLQIFKNEIYKSITILKVIGYIISLILIISVTGIIIKTKVLDLSSQAAYLEYMKYNLTFVLIKPLVPIVLIIFSASIIAEDYSSGVMKFFLISKLDKKNIIGGKILYLISFTLVNMIVIVFLLSVIGGFLIGNFHGFMSNEYLKIMGIYMTTAIGMLPIVLLTAAISLIVDNFQQAIGISIGILLISLMADSILMEIKGFTPTSFITYGYMFVTNMKYKAVSLTLLLGYIVILGAGNLIIFNKKDMLL